MPFVDTLCCASGQGLTIGTDQHCTAWCFHVSVMEVMRDAFHARLLSGLKSVGETRRLNSKRSQARLRFPQQHNGSNTALACLAARCRISTMRSFCMPRNSCSMNMFAQSQLNPIRNKGKFLYSMHRRRYGPQKFCSNAPNNSEQWSLSRGLPLQLKASLTFCIQGLDALLENLQ